MESWEVIFFEDAIGIFHNGEQMLYWVTNEWIEDPEVVFSIAGAIRDMYENPEKIVDTYNKGHKMEENWYFTFGFGHTDDDGNPLRNKYVKLYGTLETSRIKMINLFGQKWSMQYSEEEFLPQIDKYHLTELTHDGGKSFSEN